MKSDELRAALGSSQIDKIRQFVYSRQMNYEELRIHLPNIWIYTGVSSNIKNCTYSPFGVPIAVKDDAPFDRRELVDHLEANGVHTRPVFAGNITRQPMFDNVKYEVFGDLSGSDYVMERTFWIGVHPALTQQQLDYVVDTFDDFFKGKGLK